MATKKKSTKRVWEQVGSVGVDSGTIWISDPCYAKYAAKASEDRSKNGFPSVTVGKFEKGHEGAGVLVDTGGDCIFPVSVRRSTKGEVLEIRINLNPLVQVVIPRKVKK
jgi:hypothetical protein